MASSSTTVRPILPVLLAAFALISACAPQRENIQTAPMVTDRPDFTESALTVPARLQQLEFGQTLTQEGDTRSISIGEFLLRSGITDRLEMRISAASFAIEDNGPNRTQGLEDANIGAKFVLRGAGEGAARWKPGLAVIAGATIPSGARSFRSSHALPEVKLLAA